ncbi:MAG: GH36-type glycosyl hydrolase domain-containing protein [Bacteroidota bacterium]
MEEIHDQESIVYKTDELVQAANRLADHHLDISTSATGRSIKPLLTDAQQALSDAYQRFSKAMRTEEEVSDAVEWILDNYYIINEEISRVEADLPKSYYRKLPKLTEGRSEGLPKVYDLVLDFAQHTDNSIDRSSIEQFVQGYQEVTALTLGELWAIPLMIRLVLIKRLQEKTKRILIARENRKKAEQWIDKLREELEADPHAGTEFMQELKHKKWIRNREFLVALAHQLQYGGRELVPEQQWLERVFEHQGTTLERELKSYTQQQSALQVSVRNAITSLRKTQESDWSEFVEHCSVVERTFRLDPAMIYPNMDFESRDRYRRRVEELSDRSEKDEFDIAEEVLLLAESSKEQPEKPDSNAGHIGYYLIDEGRTKLEQKIGYRKTWNERIGRRMETWPILYPITITAFSLILLSLVFGYLQTWSASLGVTIATLVITALPASKIAVSLTNQLLTLLIPPRVLPKMNYEKGVPKDTRALMVVPTMFTSPEDARQKVDALEVRALTCMDEVFRFALLSDLPDADQQVTPGDKRTIEAAQVAIRQLNQKYTGGQRDRFFLLHRHRKWNSNEHKWMGWERKRGKLEQLNNWLLSEDSDCPFEETEGRVDQLRNGEPIRYIVTLDTDTRVAPESAQDLVRTAAHPLNRPIYDPEKRRVVKGYAILQPKISIAPDRAYDSQFSRIFSGNVGIDPYTTAVSDVYQDSFGEGVFTGKGLYVLKEFHQAVGNRFKEDRILSHDLIESNFARSALVTDIELYEDYPVTYPAFAKRLHRWIRGDWQIMPWIFPWVPGTHGWESNSSNMISRWKVADNLRRSLEPAGTALLLFSGWSWMPGSPLAWTGLGLGAVFAPHISHVFEFLVRRPVHLVWKNYLSDLKRTFLLNLQQGLITLVILLHMALFSMDAVLRTLWRLWLSREHLLEWKTAQQVEIEEGQHLADYYEFMRSSWVIALLAVGAIGWWGNPVHWLAAMPILLLWILAPYISWELGQIEDRESYVLSPDDRKDIRLYLRRSWLFFERYVDEKHSWLPPDNVQDDPEQEPAMRTSPTNIGLGILSTVVASDLGYLSRASLIQRLTNTISSMWLLEKYKGHFFNWYNVVVGEVLNPRYISTVDSGNLAGSLMVLEVSLKELKREIWPNPRFFEGLRDTLAVIEENKIKLRNHGHNQVATELDQALQKFKETLPDHVPKQINRWWQNLEQLRAPAQQIANINLGAIRRTFGDRAVNNYEYTQRRLLEQVDDQAQELYELFPSLATGIQLPDEINQPQPIIDWLVKLRELRKTTTEATVGVDLDQAIKKINMWLDTIDQLIYWSRTMVNDMDFGFLFNKAKGLFSIGFNLDKAELDNSTYDLLASEARLASLIAIAKAEVPVKHWFMLSRRLTNTRQGNVLLSWSGTMFEYLMPLLFMRIYPGTLLYNTSLVAMRHQQDYGQKLKKPWGVSESAYYVMNQEMDYQYRAFGVPGLGLKRGLAEEYVVAPYATMLAMMLDPQSALRNLKSLKEEGAYGPLGFYESIDYTERRLPEGQTQGLSKTYMAHHQGMSILAMANVLLDNVMQNRFHRHAKVRSTELLLQEQIPTNVAITELNVEELGQQASEEHTPRKIVEYLTHEDLRREVPVLQTLSNGSYSTKFTFGGSGASECYGVGLNRWIPDPARTQGGFYFYVRDLDKQALWSVSQDPVPTQPDRYEGWQHAGVFELAHVEHWTEAFMEVCVSPLDNIELRRITLTNYADHTRRLDLTSYAEVVLQDPAADLAHPAFSKLFVQTDFLPEQEAILAHRRKRSDQDPDAWMVHTLTLPHTEYLPGYPEYETNRALFIGRGRSLSNPAALDPNATLSRQSGNVLDPIVSQRVPVTLGPGEKVQFTFGLGFGQSREEVVDLAEKYRNRPMVDRVFNLAKAYGLMELEQLDISGSEAMYNQRLASSLIYNHTRFRATDEILEKNRKTQSGLWSYGISGDVPILVYRIHDTEQIGVVDTLIKAHRYWKKHGLEVAIVIMNEHPSSYADELHRGIMERIEQHRLHHRLNQRGGLFVLRAEEVPVEDQYLILSVAHVVFRGDLPKFDDLLNVTRSAFSGAEQVRLDVNSDQLVERERAYAQHDSAFVEECEQRSEELLHYNEFGGFGQDGDTYQIWMPYDQQEETIKVPPAPWVNVLANENFGTIISDQGGSYTWSKNSRENRLTPWFNDPVMDPTGEVLLIGDTQDGGVWSPFAGYKPGRNGYWVEHGFGYSRFEHVYRGIRQISKVTVDRNAPVKLTELTLKNETTYPRRLHVMSVQDLVMGVFREQSARHIGTDIGANGRMYAVNHYNNEFAGQVAFSACVCMDAGPLKTSQTTERQNVWGDDHQQHLEHLLLSKESLESKSGFGREPCFAHKAQLKLNPNEEVRLIMITGSADHREQADHWMDQFQMESAFDESLAQTKAYWTRTLGQLRISTPVRGIDLMGNGWLQYQNLSSRIWARSGFYQSGGAFGFRDQLQDSLSLLYLNPELTKQQILLHAAHQFPEGDVLHWWHPPTNRGIRSRITDDLLWLPYAVYQYVEATGDRAILDEEIPFQEARQLEEGEEEVYLTPQTSDQKASLFEHCCRAIDRSLTYGSHGLPLMGTGDWNDGMNKVGHEGKGESVWLGFFLYDILTHFIPICKQQAESIRCEEYQEYLEQLQNNLQESGWDGRWYRRAFYDDGEPLGSQINQECKIDAIAQSWSVLSGSAPPDRARMAMDALKEHLVDEQLGIIKLLTPPFSMTHQDPGYIKGYIPGVRENGGQYTHAAIWAVKAMAALGRGNDTGKYLQMLLPYSGALTEEGAQRYKVEPYAVAADVYSVDPHQGRGGWTWYTGSAGWMYRLIIESLLGLKVREGTELILDPRIPGSWDRFSLYYQIPNKATRYAITVSNPHGVEMGIRKVMLDGEAQEPSKDKAVIPIHNDGKEHEVTLIMGNKLVSSED